VNNDYLEKRFLKQLVFPLIGPG